MIETNIRAIFLNSGGLDSLVSARLLFNQGYKLYSVFLDMGQQNVERAKESARKIAEKYCILGHEVLTLRSDKRDRFDTSNMLTRSEESAMKLRVPYPGLVSSVLAALVGVCENDEDGVLRGQNAVYLASGKRSGPRPEGDFAHKRNIQRVLSGGLAGEQVLLQQPLEGIKFMEDIVAKGYDAGVTLDEMSATVSCNKAIPCGVCHKCLSRKELGIEIN